MLIREAKADDATAIARVQVDTWRTTYKGIVVDEFLESMSYQSRQELWSNILNSRTGNCVFVADDCVHGIVGFASGGIERSQHPLYQGELYAIYLLKECQRQGIGHRLVVAVADELKRSGLGSMLVWVLADNPSRHFYERLGGKMLEEKTIEIGGQPLVECAYVWDDISAIVCGEVD